MKKFMILQLGLILALASSNALAAARSGEKVGGADKASEVLRGNETRDKKLIEAAAKAGEAQAGTRESIEKALKEDSVSSKVAMPAKGNGRTPMQQAEAANVKILKLAEGDSLGMHSARVIEILSKSRGTELEKLQLIADEIGKTKEQLLAKCEE